MNNKKNITLMAWSSGQVSKEAGSSTKYIGVASVTIEAINPNKAQLAKIFGTEPTEEPVYTGVQEQDGNKVRYARIDAIVHTVPENNNGIDYISHMSIFLREQYRYSRDQKKIQVIDKYGRTAWVTSDELKEHAIPTFSNGKKANLDSDYRPCYLGEEDITNFFKAFLNIPSPMVYKNNEWVPADNIDDCQARFDNIKNAFNGDFSEFETAWKLQQANKVKVLFGIRNGEGGRQYQNIYTRMFLRNGQSSYDRLEADLKATQEAGGYSTSEFQIVPLQEYTVEHTPLEATPNAQNPFGDPAKNPFFE